MKSDNKNKRILGIYPCPRGYGFALFDAPDFLTDWGVARVFGKETDAYLVRVEAMLDRYAPDIIALPHPADCARKPMLRKLAAALIRRTSLRPVVVQLVTKDNVRRAFPPSTRTRYDRAVFLTSALPDLKELLPPPRKIWKSEDARMYVFDALCLALATPEADSPETHTANPSV